MKKADIKKMVFEIKDCVSELKFYTILNNKENLLSEVADKLVQKKYKVDKMKNKSGVLYTESYNVKSIDEYIKIHYNAFVKESVEDSVNGLKQEVPYTREYECDILFFNKFIVAFGSAKAMDHATKNIAEWLNVGFDVVTVPTEIMNKLPDFFEELYMIDGKDIDHPDIKSEKIVGKVKDVQDFIAYNHNINSVQGLCKTPIEEIKLTIKKSGKIKFHTKKETNIFTGHVMYGWCLLTGEVME